MAPGGREAIDRVSAINQSVDQGRFRSSMSRDIEILDIPPTSQTRPCHERAHTCAHKRKEDGAPETAPRVDTRGVRPHSAGQGRRLPGGDTGLVRWVVALGVGPDVFCWMGAAVDHPSSGVLARVMHLGSDLRGHPAPGSCG